VVAALIVSILLHGLVLSTYRHQRAATLSSPQKELASRLTITLQSSDISKNLSSNNTIENHQEKSMAPLAIQAQQNRASRRTEPQYASDHDSTNSSPLNEHISSQSPSIDIDSAHEIARKYVRESAKPSGQHSRPDTLALEQDTALGKSIAKSARPDCRNAQSNKSEMGGGFTFTAQGLLAIPFLINSAVSDNGCKW
jgi:hypothetical protein